VPFFLRHKISSQPSRLRGSQPSPTAPAIVSACPLSNAAGGSDVTSALVGGGLAGEGALAVSRFAGVTVVVATLSSGDAAVSPLSGVVAGVAVVGVAVVTDERVLVSA
jgi:hypothetical protein